MELTDGINAMKLADVIVMKLKNFYIVMSMVAYIGICKYPGIQKFCKYFDTRFYIISISKRNSNRELRDSFLDGLSNTAFNQFPRLQEL